MSKVKERYVFPFFWQHGEDEETLRHYMEIIEKADCHAVCVESRPHPDFCGPGWWHDMDIILDEARRRDMKVWILDDSHFPTGFANGAVNDAPDELHRQSIYTKIYPVREGQRSFKCNVEKAMKKLPSTAMGRMWNFLVKNRKIRFEDDRVLALLAKVKGKEKAEELPFERSGEKLTAQLPEGTEKVYLTFLTRNAGIHRNYINMMDEESCRLQISAVYEPHWEHYKEDFGHTIAGFFSDEPEIGNGVYFTDQVKVGTDFDLPWSRELEQVLAEELGDEWKQLIPLLWENDADAAMKARVRYCYMDHVTRLVEQDFSRQIGDWCHEHGVEYIGHMIEDNNQHARLGASLGHYFRGLSGQHMAGIDDIGGQVLPQKEDAPAEGIAKMTGGRDGEFYHYLLGKLGASCAAIDPVKEGRCMCEIFGNYGWGEGPRLEKYLADHFMVQGVNRFVPHAFSPKKYPDTDCPPHFYAGGHNPQYRHFGQVVTYMNRICAMLSGGKSVTETAVLYHGEGEWAGEFMLSQKPARILMEHQIDFHIVPCDIFEERERYRTHMDENGLHVNGYCYKTLIIPWMQYIPKVLAEAITNLEKSGCRVLFLDRFSDGIAQGGVWEQPDMAQIVNLGDLPGKVQKDMEISPASWRMRVFHYQGEKDFYYLVNEDDKPYTGTLSVSEMEECYAYDAWTDTCFVQECRTENGRTYADISLYPGESIMIVRGRAADAVEKPVLSMRDRIQGPRTWIRSICRAVEYPRFTKETEISSFGDYGKEDKYFSGFIAYEGILPEAAMLSGTAAPTETLGGRIFMKITDAGEDVEVFVNGTSLGIQVLPPFVYELTEALRDGENKVRIEIATTLERERKADKKNWKPTGITGAVEFYRMR